MKVTKLVAVVCIVFLVFVFFSACDQDSGYQMMSCNSSGSNHISSSYQVFDGSKIKTIQADKGQTIVFSYTSEVQQGELSIKLVDENDNLIAELPANTIGKKDITFEKDGNYKLSIVGNDTEGSFDVSWETR